MIEILSIALGIILFSRIIEDKFNIPITLTLILSTFAISYFNPEFFALEDKEFDNILYMMLPIILLPDVLGLSIKELEKNSKMFFVMAFVVVLFSIAFATAVSYFVGTSYNLSIGALVLLFTILMATDAITVSSIFSKFPLPHKLKIYAEGESLFNDVTALILFYFVALPLISGEVVSILQVNLVIFKVIFLSVLVGLVCALIGFIGIKLLNDVIEQYIVIYMVVISSFIIAEHFHIAGILSIVVSILAFKLLLHRDLRERQHVAEMPSEGESGSFYKKIAAKFNTFESLSKKDFRTYKKSSYFIGIFANAFVFIAMVSTIDFKLLMEVKYEILFVFALTTTVRFVFMTGVLRYNHYPFRWSNTLTLAGAKGGLAVIMAHSIPYEFIHRDMFISIVNGVVLLSIFVYTFILMFYIHKNRENFLMDGEIYKEGGYDKDKPETLDIDTLKNDPLTGAYSDSFIEDIIVGDLKDLAGGDSKFSLVLVKLDNLTQYRRKNEKSFILDKFGATVLNLLLTKYHFGKFSDDTYVVSMHNTPVEEALAWSKELESQLNDVFNSSTIKIELNFGIAQADSSDSYDMLIEKVQDGLEDEDKYKIEY